jgi:hypothetical protein
VGFFGDLLEETGLSGLLSDGEWRTLKNGKRIKIAPDGRIVAGLPSKYHGTHIRDLSKLTHDERQLEGIDCKEAGHCHTCKKTFRTKDEAYVALLKANPRLDELRQGVFGQYDLAFVKWQRNGRRGPKPRQESSDGRLDAVNEYYDLRGAARVASFTEAIYHTIPTSKRWEDLAPRLKPLGEAAGMEINPPDELLRLETSKLTIEECHDQVDQQLAALFEKAKGGRLEQEAPAAAGAGDAPF